MIGDSESGFNDTSHADKDRRVYSKVAQDLTWESSETDQKIRLEVISHSMSPTLKPGDKVVVEKTVPESLRTGDLVVIRKRGEFITHRLVCRGPGTWITKGDGWRHLDPPVSEESILGRVVTIERKEAQISLLSSRWKLANLGLGYIHFWQGLFFGFLRGWKSRLKRKS